ncbi:unnamed protein product [Toxocara canis]|uniref:Huntingtin n=1 Tax=Toxocara canis TaxID=6265 RepID=A0A183TVS4_TOXCA|nr:unnamed protein product [Toxocara canis]
MFIRTWYKIDLELQVYGKTKREFGFPAATYRLEEALTLPERTVSTFMSTCAHLCGTLGHSEKLDWLMSCASLFAAPGFHHNRLRMQSLDLLAVLSPNPEAFFNNKICYAVLRKYYTQDSALFAEMVLSEKDRTLQLSLLNAFAAHAKQMLLKRPRSFHRHMKDCFESIVEFVTFLSQGFRWSGADREPLLDCFLLTCCMYMAAGHASTDELLSHVGIVLFSEDILFANRCKEILAARIAYYSCTNVQDNTAIFINESPPSSFSSSTLPEQSTQASSSDSLDNLFIPTVAGELRTAFDMSELRPVTIRSGDRPSATAEKFCVASEWMMNLLEYLLEQFDGCAYEGKRCVAAAQIIVQLIGQHTTEQLSPLIDFFGQAIDFTTTHLERSAANERHQVYIRMVIAILSLCSAAVSEEANESSSTSDTFAIDNISILAEDAEAGLESPAEVTADVGSVNDEEAEEDLEDEQQNDETGDAGEGQDEVIRPQPNSERDLSSSMLRLPPLSGFAHNFASKFVDCGAMSYCFSVLSSLLSYSDEFTEKPKQNESILPVISRHLHPDLSPLFNSSYTSGVNAEDIFASYTAMVSESALRLACLLKKILFERDLSGDGWNRLLCDYMSRQPQKNERLARRLLLSFCGSDKKKYREVRDEHSILDILRYLKMQFEDCATFEYTKLSEIVKRVDVMWMLAEQRTNVWQKICVRELPWLLELACTIPEKASGAALSVLLLAVRPTRHAADDSVCCSIVNRLLGSKKLFILLCRLINRYLMGDNDECRFAMHALLRSTLQLASRRNQLEVMHHLLDVVWPQAQKMGSRAAQLVDIIASYASRFYTM